MRETGAPRLVELTDKGKDLIQCAFRQHALDMEEAIAVLTPAELVELVRLLKKVGMFAAARLSPRGRDAALA